MRGFCHSAEVTIHKMKNNYFSFCKSENVKWERPQISDFCHQQMIKPENITWTKEKLNVQIQNTKIWSGRRSQPRTCREHHGQTETISAGTACISQIKLFNLYFLKPLLTMLPCMSKFAQHKQETINYITWPSTHISEQTLKSHIIKVALNTEFSIFNWILLLKE